MIDLRAARNDPDGFRAALARKGAAEAFDALLAADERWRALVPRIDELRGKTKLKGKPSPEQLAELQQVKEELRAAEAEYAAAEAERDRLALRVPNLPHPDVPDGSTEDDVEEVRRVGEPRPGEAREHTEVGRFDMERAARMSGARFGYWIGDTARLALALYRFALDRLAEQGFTTVLPPVLVREEALVGTGAFPSDEANVYEVEADGLYLAGTAEIPPATLHPAGHILGAATIECDWNGIKTVFSGDLGRFDEDGNLSITGRIKDFINVGGYKVNPAEVEQAIAGFPGVESVGVAGVEGLDGFTGETVVAGVVAAAGANVDLVALEKHCLASLEKFKAPGHFVLIDQVPRSDTGKTKRQELAKLLAEVVGTLRVP